MAEHDKNQKLVTIDTSTLHLMSLMTCKRIALRRFASSQPKDDSRLLEGAASPLWSPRQS